MVVRCVAVIGGNDGYGEDFATLRLFDKSSDAMDYGSILRNEFDYDYFLHDILEVEE